MRLIERLPSFGAPAGPLVGRLQPGLNASGMINPPFLDVSSRLQDSACIGPISVALLNLDLLSKS